MRVVIFLVLVSLLGFPGPVFAQCMDVASAKTFVVDGRLDHVIFPGPPNYSDVRQGDAPEPTYILRVPVPFCVTGDEFIGEDEQVETIHLIPTAETESALRDSIGRSVRAVIVDQFGAHTGHHHAPLVATALSVSPAEPEHGTGATVVRGFYYALAAGDGDAAADFVVPEKRERGPLSAQAMTNFYRNLTVPLQLASVEPLGEDRYLARYTFQNRSDKCDGRAEVTTVRRGSQNLILRIKALDGC